MADADDLARSLSESLGDVTIDGLRRLSGGASRDTWRFSADGRDLVVQQQRPGDERNMVLEADVVRAASTAGVAVPALVVSGDFDDGSAFMILEAVEGETIARKIQRDAEYSTARARLVEQFGTALARVHSMPADAVAGLEHPDAVSAYTEALDDSGQPHPALELVRRWLIDHRPVEAEPTVVHGDFRLGNMLVGFDGLNAVIDWELAHVGDPMEDLGWLCVKAWRFGQAPPVAGLGDRDELFAAYERAGGRTVDLGVVRWWEILGTWKWAIMCILQAKAHLGGAVRSHELAAIGRRVCESEHDLFVALDGHW